jgi:hypothetical protein
MAENDQLPILLIRRVPILNVDTLPIPPYALLAFTGVSDEGFITVKRPTRNSQTDLLINGPGVIPPLATGAASQTFPAIVAYDEDLGVTPAAGDTWGSVADSWFLDPTQTGFMVIGGAGAGLVNVVVSGKTQTVPVVIDVACVGGGIQQATVNLVFVNGLFQGVA